MTSLFSGCPYLRNELGGLFLYSTHNTEKLFPNALVHYATVQQLTVSSHMYSYQMVIYSSLKLAG